MIKLSSSGPHRVGGTQPHRLIGKVAWLGRMIALVGMKGRAYRFVALWTDVEVAGRLRGARLTGRLQLEQMDLDSDRAEEVMPQTVRPYQRAGVRVFVYEGLTGCGNDDAILRILPPVMFPELPYVADCSVPQRYLAVFAVPAKLVPNPLDIGCTPGPITCPRR